jgi:pimeloyl-ACP methyl ester carboxylesterase
LRYVEIMTLSEQGTTEPFSTVRLRDGRAIGYLEVGNAAGLLIFHFHGHGSSRLEALVLASKAAATRVRLIALDRPGIGQSDPKPSNQLLDWPDDVAEVADQLEIARFAVEGVSAGGPYALACAYKIPHRVSACGFDQYGLSPRPRPGGRPRMDARDMVAGGKVPHGLSILSPLGGS